MAAVLAEHLWSRSVDRRHLRMVWAELQRRRPTQLWHELDPIISELMRPRQPREVIIFGMDGPAGVVFMDVDTSAALHEARASSSRTGDRRVVASPCGDSAALVLPGGVEVVDTLDGISRVEMSLDGNHAVRGVAFSPDGRLLAVAGSSAALCVVSLPGGDTVAELAFGADDLSGGFELALDCEGRIAMGGERGRLLVSDLRGRPEVDMSVGGGRVTAMAFVPLSDHIALAQSRSANAADDMVVVSLGCQEILFHVQLCCQQHCSFGCPVSLAFSADARRLSFASAAGNAYTVDWAVAKGNIDREESPQKVLLHARKLVPPRGASELGFVTSVAHFQTHV